VIGGVHVQRDTNRKLTFNAFFSAEGAQVYVCGLVFAGDHLLAMPDLEFERRSAAIGIEVEVAEQMFSFMDRTAFGPGTGPDPSRSTGQVHSRRFF